MNFRSILLFLAFLPAILRADDVVFFKNSGQHRMFCWVNEAYQGWVDPGTTAYMPREGFVTQDSGFQPDGTLKTTHSHGGWEVGGLFTYKVFSSSFELDDVRVAYYTTGTVPYNNGDKRVGIAPGKGLTAVLPSDYDMETAKKIQGGHPPRDLEALLSVGKEEIPYGGGANSVGSITDGASFPVWYAGKKKLEQNLNVVYSDTLAEKPPYSISMRRVADEEYNVKIMDGDLKVLEKKYLNDTTNSENVLNHYIPNGKVIIYLSWTFDRPGGSPQEFSDVWITINGVEHHYNQRNGLDWNNGIYGKTVSIALSGL
jgi:hypothetical protein